MLVGHGSDHGRPTARPPQSQDSYGSSYMRILTLCNVEQELGALFYHALHLGSTDVVGGFVGVGGDDGR